MSLNVKLVKSYILIVWNAMKLATALQIKLITSKLNVPKLLFDLSQNRNVLLFVNHLI